MSPAETILFAALKNPITADNAEDGLARIRAITASTLTNAEIVAVIFAGTNGFLDTVPVKEVGRFEKGLLAYLRSTRKDVLEWLTKEDPKIKGDAEKKLKDAIAEFAKTFA